MRGKVAMVSLVPGSQFEFPFRLARGDVEKFVDLSGDNNYIHADDVAAARSPIGRIAVPGLLSALVFSRVLGTAFPGHGTVYKSQTLHWKHAMFVETDYIASFTVLVTAPSRWGDHISAQIKTEIRDAGSGEIKLMGEASVLYPSGE
jgi:acyl dehydratase